VLFDGKRQKTLTKVVAIIAIVAFAGFGLVAGGLAVSGGCGTADPLQQAIDDAQSRATTATSSVTTAQAAVKASPKSAQAKRDLVQAKADLAKAQSTLAQARVAKDPNDPSALDDALAATRNAPDNGDIVLGLITVASAQNNPGAALPAIAIYTQRNPNDAQMFAYWGQAAEQAGQRNQAVLAYQRFLQLAPDDTLAPDIRARLKQLAKQSSAGG